MKIISIVNQKGGVGKTTTSISLAASLADKGYKTMLIDMDPQGNAGSGLGINKFHVEKSIYHALIGDTPLRNVIREADIENLWIVPANRDLIGAEVELIQAFSRETKLKTALRSVQDEFDYIIIDCPPSLNILTVNALTASDHVIVPVQCEYYALEGISELIHTISLIQSELNPNLQIGGVVMTMFDSRNNLAHQVIEEVRGHFKDKVFSSIIPRAVKLSESPSHGQPIHIYDAKSKGAQAYQELAEEVIERSQWVRKKGLVLLGNG